MLFNLGIPSPVVEARTGGFGGVLERALIMPTKLSVFFLDRREVFRVVMVYVYHLWKGAPVCLVWRDTQMCVESCGVDVV